ncbi:Nif3-like dinuclear metal center hexameric protein [Schnuerera sp.]|uniref:Nif3-like dinuclear metal center hexameric protein n=1 Tax=Schnuerera sp. TaxID=2794844 RepID=UPI002C0BF05B|nr:Nif3-like dinuclear metal center hexameric protein [Schnuerera sp.]HSH35346.1 Nif3-like dinuclear metal center hexameric protein [Schnuerera sp.]
MKAKKIINLLNQWALPYLIDEWDNTGFQIGDPQKDIKKILVSLDLDRKVLERAVDEKVQMIITHHPVIFKPLKSITKLTYKEKLIYDLIREDIVVYNAHTSLDLTLGGVNDVLANLLGIDNTEPLKIVYEESLLKLVIFVPNDYVSSIRKVLGQAGGGWIGNYSHCTFNTEGIGTFKPLEGTKPFIGKTNIIEEVEETRIETIVKERDLNRILDEVIKNHPYEEVAYDIYPLINKGKVYGYGRIGEVEEIFLSNYLDIIKDSLMVGNIIVYGNQDRKVKKVAVCGGSGSSFIHDAYLKGADIFITGDVKYHEAQYADELGLTIIDAGHYHTEKVILPEIKKYINENLTEKIDIIINDESSPPYVVY